MKRAWCLALLCGCVAMTRQAPPPAPAETAPTELAEGAAAPDVTAPTATGKPLRLADLRGKLVVLYFYPVDFSASGTAEAEELRDDYPRYRKLGVTVVG